MAERKKIDYHLLKGVDYTPSYAHNDLEEWRDYDEMTVERELSYAARMGLNCIRPFLNYVVYADNKDRFLRNLLHMVRTADSLGLKVMPVIFDSCFTEIEPSINLQRNEWIPNPGVMNLGEVFWPKAEEYCKDIIDLLMHENGLLLWDVMNEPLCTSYTTQYSPEINEKHKQEIYRFLKHFCCFFHENDLLNPITVGHSDYRLIADTQEWEDVLSFHTYAATELSLEAVMKNAVAVGKKYNKPIFCSETGCAGRANPYDTAIEIAVRNNVGYFLWELMIGESFWNDRHGIVYTDGTIRDASIVAAINGFFRRRENRTPYNADTEGFESRTITQIEEWLHSENKDFALGLEIASCTANLLEGNQLVPECNLPTGDYFVMKRKADLSVQELSGKLAEWQEILKADIERKQYNR